MTCAVVTIRPRGAALLHMYRNSNNGAVAKETYSFHTHVNTLLPTLRTMSAESAAVAARRRFAATQIAPRPRAPCVLQMEMGWAVDGKVDASESQTLARAPGPRGANGTCASHVETKRRTKHLHAPLHYLYFGEERRAREAHR